MTNDTPELIPDLIAAIAQLEEAVEMEREARDDINAAQDRMRERAEIGPYGDEPDPVQAEHDYQMDMEALEEEVEGAWEVAAQQESERSEVESTLAHAIVDWAAAGTDESLRQQWGPLLRKWRQASGLTMERVASTVLRSTSATVSRYENGDRLPTLDTVLTQAGRLVQHLDATAPHPAQVRGTGDGEPSVLQRPDRGGGAANELRDLVRSLSDAANDELLVAAERLSSRQRAVLTRLAKHPEAIDSIAALRPDPLRAALANALDRGV